MYLVKYFDKCRNCGAVFYNGISRPYHTKADALDGLLEMGNRIATLGNNTNGLHCCDFVGQFPLATHKYGLADLCGAEISEQKEQ